MALQYYINDVLVDSSYIVADQPVSDEKISLNESELISSTWELKLLNIDGTYSTMEPTSFIYGVDWYNATAMVFDTEQNIVLRIGRIKNVKEVRKDNTVTFTIKNWVRDLIDDLCTTNSVTDITPAEHIYNILVDTIGVDPSYINYQGFQRAISIQEANSAYVQMLFTRDKNKKCISVVKELLRMSHCRLYTKNNYIYFYQYETYNGEIGYQVKAKHIEVDSFVSEFNDSNIFNDYRIAYDAGAGSIAWGNASSDEKDDDSIDLYGQKIFAVPEKDMESSDTDSFNILFLYAAGAQWSGNLAIERFANLRQFCNYTLMPSMNFVNMHDYLALAFSPFVNEPCRVVEISEKDNKKKVKAEFLNIPYEFFERDVSAPAIVEAVSAEWISDHVRLTWSISPEEDFLGYKIYITTSPGEWEAEYCHLGRSPVDIKNPSTELGYNYVDIYQLNQGTRYYFKIKVYDTSYNESSFSNIVDTG